MLRPARTWVWGGGVWVALSVSAATARGAFVGTDSESPFGGRSWVWGTQAAPRVELGGRERLIVRAGGHALRWETGAMSRRATLMPTDLGRESRTVVPIHAGPVVSDVISPFGIDPRWIGSPARFEFGP